MVEQELDTEARRSVESKHTNCYLFPLGNMSVHCNGKKVDIVSHMPTCFNTFRTCSKVIYVATVTSSSHHFNPPTWYICVSAGKAKCCHRLLAPLREGICLPGGWRVEKAKEGKYVVVNMRTHILSYAPTRAIVRYSSSNSIKLKSQHAISKKWCGSTPQKMQEG
jgi:hypothetical protein